MRNIVTLTDLAREVGAGITVQWVFAEGRGRLLADASAVYLGTDDLVRLFILPYPFTTQSLWDAVKAVEAHIHDSGVWR